MLRFSKIFTIVLLLFVHSVKAQIELGLTGGVSYYIGDLNPYQHFRSNHCPYQHFRSNHFAGGIFLRDNVNDRFAWRLSFTYGNVSGADSLSSNPNRSARNLSFRSRIIEIGPIFELTFVKFSLGN